MPTMESSATVTSLLRGKRWLKASRQIAVDGFVDPNIFASILYTREASTPLWFLKLVFRLLPDDMRKEEYTIGTRIVAKEHGPEIYAFFKDAKSYERIVAEMQGDKWRFEEALAVWEIGEEDVVKAAWGRMERWGMKLHEFFLDTMRRGDARRVIVMAFVFKVSWSHRSATHLFTIYSAVAHPSSVDNRIYSTRQRQKTSRSLTSSSTASGVEESCTTWRARYGGEKARSLDINAHRQYSPTCGALLTP